MDIIILGKARRGGERVKETESNKAKARVGQAETGTRQLTGIVRLDLQAP